MNAATVCRSCMSEVEECNDNFTHNIVEMFTFCTNIQVLEADGLPEHFCSNCSNQIQTSYKFITQAHQVNETLKLLHQNRENSVKVETNIETDFKYDSANQDFCDESTENDVNPSLQKEDSTVNINKKLHKKTKVKKKLRSRNFDKNKKNKCKEFEELDNEEFRKEIDTDFVTNLICDANKNLDSHNKTDTKIKYKDIQTKDELRNICSICHKVFATGTKGQYWLNRHLKAHNSVEDKVKYMKTEKQEPAPPGSKVTRACPICQKSFTSQIWFSRHMDNEHSTFKTYTCPFCGKVLETKNQLRHHRATHVEDKKHECNACGKRFRLRKHLAVHALSHSDERPYICDACHMSFKMKHVLINHLKVHENVKTFLCCICGRNFSTEYNLKEHMNTHTGERPFACGQCEYRSSQQSSLRRHELRRHYRVRRHACAQCGKTFFDTVQLARHTRIHTGERPYKCPHCQLGFIDIWRRKLHLMRVHQLSLEEIPRLNREGGPATR